MAGPSALTVQEENQDVLIGRQVRLKDQCM